MTSYKFLPINGNSFQRKSKLVATPYICAKKIRDETFRNEKRYEDKA